MSGRACDGESPCQGLVSRDDGLAFVRLVTGLAGVVMLAIPVGRLAIESSSPFAERVVVAQAVPHVERLPKAVSPSSRTDDAASDTAPVAAAQAESTFQPRTFAVGPAQRHTLRVAAHHVRRGAASEHRRASMQAARDTRVLTRAQIVREYLASREQMAALTGEDSGSAWLTRVAARQRTVQW